MSHEVETIAWKNEVPWHGLGVEVPDNASVEDMILAANLNWTVSKRHLNAVARVDYDRPTINIPNYQALMRDSDDQVYSIVGSKYKPIQNVDSIGFFKKFVDAGKMKMEVVGSLRTGAFVWGLASINKSFDLGNDQINGYLLMMSPHIFGMSMVFDFTSVRVVCMNTMKMALGSSIRGSKNAFRVTHSQTFDNTMKAKAEEALGIATTQFDEFSEIATHLSAKRAMPSEVTEYFYEVNQLKPPAANDDKAPRVIKRFEEALINAPGQDLKTSEGTWWGAYNAVTYVADHLIGRTRDNGLSSAWYGPNELVKKRALNLAIAKTS